MRVSRPCWDKPHRCPGWAGGGWKSASVDRCDNGYVTYWKDSDRTRFIRFNRRVLGRYISWHAAFSRSSWRFGHCNKCDVVTLPFAWRRIDPRYWAIFPRLWRIARKSP